MVPGTQIVMIGGGGHSRSVKDVLANLPATSLVAVVDPSGRVDWDDAVEVLTGDEQALAYVESSRFLITVGQVGTGEKRKQLFDFFQSREAVFATIISPHSYVSQTAHIGEGTVVHHGVVVNDLARIGMNCIINSKALIEHDCLIGDHVHISTGALVNGGCEVGAGSMIGSGAVLKQGVKIGAGVVIGAGAVVTRNIEDAGTYVGTPAKKIQP